MSILEAANVRKWEDVDHEDSIAGQLAGPAASSEGEGDPLGLGAFVECVHVPTNSATGLLRFLYQCERHGYGIPFVCSVNMDDVRNLLELP